MANWTTVKEWLGLSDAFDPAASDYDEYDEYEDGNDYDDPSDTVYDAPAVRAVPPSSTRTRGHDRGRAGGEEWEEGDGGVRVISSVAPTEEPRGIVRPLPTAASPVVMAPSSFNDAPQMADVFKENKPLILNMQAMDRDLSRRLVDFCSGFCYVLDGKMERITDHVFLLTPEGAVVSDDDRQKIRDGDLQD